jgi:hypothetical protein
MVDAVVLVLLLQLNPLLWLLLLTRSLPIGRNTRFMVI